MKLDTIDNLVVDGQEPVSTSIDDLNTSTMSTVTQKPLPQSATDNQSAVLSAISGDGKNVVENYTRMQNETAMGDSTFKDSTLQHAQELTRVATFKNGILPILYDPLADISSKQKVLNDFKSTVSKPDSLTILSSESLIADSQGDTGDSDKARISLSDDLFGNFQKSYKEQQQLVNNFKQDLAKKATGIGTAEDLAQEMLVPLAEGIKAYSFMTDLNKRLGKDTTFEKGAKAFFRPGATMEEYRNQYENLDDSSRIAFVRNVLDTIKDTQGVVFSADSQFAATALLEKVIGDYSPAEASWDTISNALDIFGIGMGLRSAKKAITTAREARKIAKGVLDESVTSPAASSLNPSVSPLDVPKDISTSVPHPEKEKLASLFDQKAELVANSSGVLPNRSVYTLNKELETINPQIEQVKGSFKEQVKDLQIRKQMSRKEAESAVNKMNNDQLTDLNARKQRIESLLEQNRVGQKAQDKVRDIETEIDRISNLPDKNGVLKVNPIVDGMNRIERNSLVAVENPASVGSIFYKTNPEKSRSVAKLVYESSDDKISQALLGMNRTEALGDMIMPKQITESGAIAGKPVDVMKDIKKPDTPLIDQVKNAVAEKDSVELTPREKATAASNVVNDFKSPTKIKVVDGMDGFKVDHIGGKINLSSVYGNAGGSFSNAEDALAQVNLALRQYGDMTPNATILKKSGVDYVPVNLKDVKGVDGDYLVRIDFSKQLDKSDVLATGPLDEFKARFNYLDSVPQFVSEKSGSLTRHLLSVGAIFDKHLTTAASVGDALTARVEKILQTKIAGIVSDIKKLPKIHQDKIAAYFVEANEKGIPLTKTDMVNREFTLQMQNIVKNWREYWDSVWDLTNTDAGKTLKNQGYQLLDNGTDKFFARPIGKDISKAKGYDPDTGKMILLNRKEMDDLYAKGGSIAELRNSFELGGETVERLIVKNDTKNFLRGIGENDRVLNYREGYYLTSYRAPIFIDRIDPKTGKAMAVATAKDKREADLFIKRKLQDNPDEKYISRPDKKKQADQKEDVWNLNYEGGITSQRRRGKPLVEADGSNRLEGAAYFDSPMESAVRASRSIAGRSVYRDILETAKARAMQKHGDLFPTENGVTKFPSKVSDISSRSGKFGKDVRDARTDFEYIHYLENGYINGTDSLFKSIAGVIAEGVGNLAIKLDSKVLSSVERGARKLEDTPFSGIGKGIVFNSYIATNVLRQWIVQPGQILRLAAYDPLGLPGALRLAAEYSSFLASGKALTKHGQGFVDFVEKTGMLDSVDKSNLVRGTLMTSGEQAGWWKSTGGKLTEAMRTVGYDLGEKTNRIGHMAAVYNKYAREGKVVTTPEARTEMLGKAAALSYDMGFAGDMPYNQNFLSLFTQFLQVPHKAVLQAFERRLTPAERTRMVVGDLLLYGAAGSTIVASANALFGEKFLDDNPETKQWLVDGALQKGANMMLDHVLTTLGTKNVGNDLDFTGSLSPFEFGGYTKVAKALLMDGGFMDALSNTPAGGLLMKDGNRVQKAIMSVGRLVGYLPDSELTPQSVLGTLNDVGKITSGWNNMQKAIVANETNKILSNSGQTLINGVSTKEAVALAFGIAPVAINDFYKNSMYLSETSKGYQDSVKQAARTAIQVAVGRTHLGLENPATLEIANAILMKAYRSSPKALEIINKEYQYALQDPTIGLERRAVEHMSLPEMDSDREKLKAMIPPEKWNLYDKWNKDIDANLAKLNEEK